MSSPRDSLIGRSVARLEDEPLVRGEGRFVDDIHVPGTLEAAFVRSPHAHAKIARIDTSAAQTAPGVIAVFAIHDLLPHVSSARLPLQFRTANLPPDITPFVLAHDEVAFVGEAVCVVIADSRYRAEDAVPLVKIDYKPLPAAVDCRDAIATGAAPAHLTRATNILTELSQSYGDIEGAFHLPARQIALSLKQHRGCAHPIEGRGALAVFDVDEKKLTLWSSTQLAHEARAHLMTLLRLDENELRVVAPDVGGGFGAKFLLYPEEVVVSAACLKLRRPVKWIEDRREHFLAAIQERDQYWDLDVAFDNQGRLRGVRGRMIHDQGAYTPQGINLPYNASSAFPGPYILPAYDLRVVVVETNKVPTLPVRGAGYPEAAFAMERVLDRIARVLGLDRCEVRRRNLVPADRMPYTVPLKTRADSPIIFDSGDFPRCQRMALEAIDYDGFADRQRRGRDAGLHLGIGVANGVKGTGRGPFESAIVRIGRSGRITVCTGAMAMGQGIKTALAQICAEQLGVDPHDITVIAGDTAVISHGQGGFASRQTVTAGSAVHMAALVVRAKALSIGAKLLRANVEDLELRDGRVASRENGDHGVTLRELAEALSGVPGYGLPGGFEPGLESLAHFMPQGLAYSMASHAVEVEVDTGTCAVRVRRYVAVSDCGRIVNPAIAEGQIVGGVVHGIGNALYEWMGYDEQGQPITTTLAEYLLPTSTEVPRIETLFLESSSPLNPLGVKGVGEVGCIPVAAAIASAVEHALAPYDVDINEYPILPARIFELITAGQRAQR